MADGGWHFVSRCVHLRPLFRHPVMKWRFTFIHSEQFMETHQIHILIYFAWHLMETWLLTANTQRTRLDLYRHIMNNLLFFTSLATLTDDTQHQMKSSLAENPPGFPSSLIWNVVVRWSCEHLPSARVNETMCTQLEVTADPTCLQLDRNSS